MYMYIDTLEALAAAVLLSWASSLIALAAMRACRFLAQFLRLLDSRLAFVLAPTCADGKGAFGRVISGLDSI